VYPDYAAAGGVVTVTQEQIDDKTKYMYHTVMSNERDLCYRQINANIILAFLASHKVKDGGDKFRSNSDMRKWHYAIQWAARMAEEPMPEEYHMLVGKEFVSSYKKESIEMKRAGKLDENDSGCSTQSYYHPRSFGIHSIRIGSPWFSSWKRV
jgi:hypothetical protein